MNHNYTRGRMEKIRIFYHPFGNVFFLNIFYLEYTCILHAMRMLHFTVVSCQRLST